MNTFRKGLDLLLGAICCPVLAIMVGIACWQVVSRYILGVPSTLTEEMLRFLRCGYQCWAWLLSPVRNSISA
ncbi:hypothetical protein JT306_17135 [Salmonella enterica subsp. enterica serovar Kentucky]|nr:hypothetical protein [Salmonella enterica subsp. enterica serovar Kentucky]